jgi:uncharacterized membrane protein YobD (UPF0266 family)
MSSGSVTLCVAIPEGFEALGETSTLYFLSVHLIFFVSFIFFAEIPYLFTEANFFHLNIFLPI